MFSVIYRYVIQYKKNVNYFYLSFKFYFAFFMIFFFVFFFFFGFWSLLHWNIFRFIGYFAYYGPLSLLLSLSLLGNFPFLFRFFSLFNFNIKTYDPSYISGVWKCSCVVLVCVLLCIISTRSLFLSFSIPLFLLVYLFFLFCCSACLSTVLHLAYLSLIIVRLYDLKLRLQKKKTHCWLYLHIFLAQLVLELLVQLAKFMFLFFDRLLFFFNFRFFSFLFFATCNTKLTRHQHQTNMSYTYG